MVNNAFRYLIFIIFIFVLIECNQNEVYYKFALIPQNEWDRYDKVTFDIDSVSIKLEHKYAISIEVTHDISYQYKNLWIYIDEIINDSVVVRDTMECLLTDYEGNWMGSGNGPTRQISILYKQNLRLDTANQYQVYIHHAMQDPILKGIEKIGLKVY